MTPIAGLDEGQRLRLGDVLRRSAVQIRVGAATAGTGFFIEPRQVLPCRHVVAAAPAPGGAAVSVTGFLDGSGEPRSAPATIAAILPGKVPDLGDSQHRRGQRRFLRDPGRLRDRGWHRADERGIPGQGPPGLSGPAVHRGLPGRRRRPGQAAPHRR